MRGIAPLILEALISVCNGGRTGGKLALPIESINGAQRPVNSQGAFLMNYRTLQNTEIDNMQGLCCYARKSQPNSAISEARRDDD